MEKKEQELARIIVHAGRREGIDILDSYFIPAHQMDSFADLVNAKKIVRIGSNYIRSWDIKRIELHPGGHVVDKHLRRAVELRIRKFERDLGRAPTESEIRGMEEKIKRGG